MFNAQALESDCRLGPQPKQSQICVSCFFLPPFRHKFARPRALTTHPPTNRLPFARSFGGALGFASSSFAHPLSFTHSLSLSLATFSAVEPLLRAQSRFNTRSFWSCSLPRKQLQKKVEPIGSLTLLKCAWSKKRGRVSMCARVCASISRPVPFA
ncbi:hypothetical protein M5D96_011487 [Drosophila gunungcola]|uniref:Uncharacterized protein n=1 Tax=Drosophila gunungcola TaxID=103775 RepID=A0A9Q0BKP3_9MUSC|nr:hypothetical protein M5D96_011487 [Drosophila gunungcola]